MCMPPLRPFGLQPPGFMTAAANERVPTPAKFDIHTLNL
jgi:hypothetical protein